MTIDEAMEMVKEKLTCMTLEDLSCIEKGCDRDCDNCVHNYGQGTSGEQKEALSIAIKALEEIQQYREIGTVKEIKIREAQFARLSDGYLTDLTALREYMAIGTPEECREAVEKQKVNKELESHDEKHILKSCIALMWEMVNEFAEWYRWQHGEDAIDELDDEELFCVRKTYFRIVQELFLLGTNHSGGTSTRAKCKQLGVDWGEEIKFGWSDEE